MDAKKKCPRQPPFPWFPPLVLSTSAYSALVLRPPTSRLAAWGNVNSSTSLKNLSNSARDFFPAPPPCTLIRIVGALSARLVDWFSAPYWHNRNTPSFPFAIDLGPQTYELP